MKKAEGRKQKAVGSRQTRRSLNWLGLAFAAFCLRFLLSAFCLLELAMSVEFRQRTPSEYARILWRRKWLIVLPALAISFAIAIVVWRLPDVYQSTTLLTVKPSSVPSTIAPQLSDEDLTLRLNNISIVVLSRSTLEQIGRAHV